MFERYTQQARRVIFFARYEASALDCDYIHPEHLILGLLREDKSLFGHMAFSEKEAIRRECEGVFPKTDQRRSTSVDIPLTHEAKRSLSYATEEANDLNHKDIDTGHLLLGLLRVEKCAAGDLLRRHGFDLTTVRKRIQNFRESSHARVIDRLNESFEPELLTLSSVALQEQIDRLKSVQRAMRENLQAYSTSYGEQHLKRKPWSRKEALGHLIDWAMAYQQWLARALTQPKLAIDEYPQEEWVSAQRYADFSWQDLVDLWLCTNRLLSHVLAQVPESKLELLCTVGIQEPITISAFVERYVQHCEDIAGQILAHL